MLDGVRALMTVPDARTRAGGPAANELTGTHACYNVFRCRDGKYVAVGALEPKFWESLCRGLGLEARAARQWEEGEKRRDTLAAVERAFASRDRAQWLEDLRAADACVEPVLDPGELPAAFAESAAPPRVEPIRLGETPATTRRPAPALGQHTEEVLAEFGYGGEEIVRMREEGVVQ